MERRRGVIGGSRGTASAASSPASPPAAAGAGDVDTRLPGARAGCTRVSK